MSVLLDGERYQLAEGQLIIYPPNAHHCGSGEAYDAHVGIVSFESSSSVLFENHSEVITISRHAKELLSDIITEGVDIFVPTSLNSGLKGLVPKNGVTVSRLQMLKKKLELFLTEVCVDDIEKKSRISGTNQSNYQKSQFEKIDEFLKSNLDKNLSLGDIATEFSVSESKLKNIFKGHCYTSPIAYFNSLKILKAKELIKESTLNFLQIAQSLGFDYENYFSRVFKEKTGLTPSEYAKSIYKNK